jgi:hypothetical protein
MPARVVPFVAACLLAASAAAQDTGAPPPRDATHPAPGDEIVPVQAPDWPAQSWLMPEVEVLAERPSDLREEERIGSYGQPRWTAHRRFPTTRIYVIPEGEIEVEYWLRVDEPRHGDDTQIRHFYEIEFGLLHRFQLDLYVDAIHDGEWEPFDETERMVELRYALADWGELWGNPTLYYEVVDRQRGPDKLEAKLLLGDEWAEGWHWGTNFVWEKETGGEEERELEFTGAVSRTLVDERFSAGAELKVAQITNDVDAAHRHEYFAGPSFQWKPSPRAHIDCAPLLGFGPDSGDYTLYFIFGWEF